MNEQYLELICTFPLFEGYTTHGARRLLEAGEIRHHEPGELLFKEGDPPNSVLLVLSGQLEVFVERDGQSLVLTTLGEGAVLGELAVMGNMPRSASVRSLNNTSVLHWSATEFRNLLLEDTHLSEQIFATVVRTLIAKERSLIESLVKLQTKLGESQPDAGKSH